jgi:hypothetical protein
MVAIAGLTADKTSSSGLAPWLGQKCDLIRSLIDDHAFECRDVIKNGFDITEHDSGLVFVLRQAHDGQGLADCDKRAEIDETGNKTGDQCRDKRFAATATDNEIGLF